jgi:hypothetical protein
MTRDSRASSNLARLSGPSGGLVAVREGLRNAIAAMRTLPPPPPRITPAQALIELRNLLASDGHAASFLSLGNYRTSMLASVDGYIRDCNDAAQ